MNWDAIGAVGEILGALAVVATLGYLAVQTRQANYLARSNAVLQLQNQMREHRNSLALSSELAQIMVKRSNGGELTELEVLRLKARNDAALTMMESIYLQYEAGIITSEDFTRHTPVMRQIVLSNRQDGVEYESHSVGFGEFLKGLTEDPPA
ncbi:MAG: hypothetical protein P8X82_07515 [Gemmatimonadales bacterium]